MRIIVTYFVLEIINFFGRGDRVGVAAHSYITKEKVKLRGMLTKYKRKY